MSRLEDLIQELRRNRVEFYQNLRNLGWHSDADPGFLGSASRVQSKG